MSFPQVVAVTSGSPAEAAGVLVGDEIRSMNGAMPRDVIEYQVVADEAALLLELNRGGLSLDVAVDKFEGEPLGIEVSSPLFDRVRTCDNHCAFCFIYQLPKGMRKSLYVKDDDFRLSFLYGNFTTLTRFTELDFARVVDERLSPLYVSIHATDPEIRTAMLRNGRGATSLRWLGLMLEHGIEVHGQVVLCPGLNDGRVLDDTLAGVLERFSALSSLGVVPLGVSRYSKEETMRPHTAAEARSVIDSVSRWQERFLFLLGRRLVFAADEFYVFGGRPLPQAIEYDGFPQLENGIGMARAFVDSFLGGKDKARTRHGGFFASVDGAPAFGYRAPRTASVAVSPPAGSRGRPTILTGSYGQAVIGPLLIEAGFDDVDVISVENRFFGGNIAVAGLLTFDDVSRALADLDDDRRFLLPDVCLSSGRFLDGRLVEELPRPVEVIQADGASLRRALCRVNRPIRAFAGDAT